MMKKHNLIDLITLRAMYNQELHAAIMNNDAEYVQNYIDSYDGDDKDWYDFTQKLDIDTLRAETMKTAGEYDHAIKTGHRIMGM